MSRKNYTDREKTELLTIVNKYREIIENKSTNAVTVEKKNNAWKKVAEEYSSSAEYPRTTKQLITAYQNFKRVSRQKAADDRQQKYVEIKLRSDLRKNKKDKAEEKKATMVSSGGTFTPVGAQMLALMGEQLKLLSNNCDSASEYFRKDEEEDGNDDENDDHIIKVSADRLQKGRGPPKDVQKKNSNPSSSRHSLNKNRQNNIYLKQKKKIESIDCIKRKIYKIKLECALLEKKTNLVNYRASRKREQLIDLEIKIKELEYTSKAK